MAYDAKPGWSRVFVSPITGGPRRTRRRAPGATLEVPAGPSVNETIDEFLEAVDDGSARDRQGRAFTREAALELHWNLGGHVAEGLGAMSVSGVRRSDVEALVYELGDTGLSRRRLRPLAKSVRALYDYAVERGLVRHNPAERIALPDEDETEQPSAEYGDPDAAYNATILDHVISTALRVTTLGFLITAVIFLGESLIG
jgi:site-specific recombinase XerC